MEKLTIVWVDLLGQPQHNTLIVGPRLFCASFAERNASPYNMLRYIKFRCWFLLRIGVKIIETFLYGEDFALQTASMVKVLIAFPASMLCCLPILPPDQLCQCFQFAKTWNYHLLRPSAHVYKLIGNTDNRTAEISIVTQGRLYKTGPHTITGPGLYILRTLLSLL